MNTWNISGQPKIGHILKHELEKKNVYGPYLFFCGEKYIRRAIYLHVLNVCHPTS